MFAVPYKRTMEGARRIARMRRQTAVILQFPAPKAEPVVVKPLPIPPECKFTRAAGLANLARMNFARAARRRIIDQVAAWHGVSAQEILGESRFKSIVAARFDAMAAIYTNCRHPDGNRYSLNEIGRVFGRDHTTVRNAFFRVGIPITEWGRSALDQRRRG